MAGTLTRGTLFFLKSHQIYLLITTLCCSYMVELSLVSVLCNMDDLDLVKVSHFFVSECLRFSNLQN